MTLNKLFTKARIDKKLSQDDLARKIGYSSAQMVSNIERGITTVPTDKLKKFCKVLNVDTALVAKMMVRNYKAEINKLLN